MTTMFFYGTLCYRPLLDLVLGSRGPAPQLRIRPARLPFHQVHWVKDQPFPMILEQDAPSAQAQGLLVEGLSDQDRARLDFYEGGFDFTLKSLEVQPDGDGAGDGAGDGGGGSVKALVYFADPDLWTPGAPWSLDDWARDWGDMTLLAAQEVMSYFGSLTAEQVAKRFAMIRLRAASKLRASQTPAPCTMRSDFGAADLVVHDARRPYSNYFTLEEHDISFRRFSGQMSAPVTRAGFVGGDAVTVLPYDPVRDCVLLVEQFRIAPYMRGDPKPWLLEPIAGRVDPGETPEDCAKREALEEAGLAMEDLRFVSAYYPSPGAVTEFVYSYVALCDLPAELAGIGGLEVEHEDIRSHILPFSQLMDLVASGEAGCGPLVLTAFWLSQNRDRLRQSS